MTNILIIDDSPIDRKIITMALANKFEDINLIERDNVSSIQEIQDVGPVDVCILDIMMPQKNGLDVLKELKNNANYKDLPVIVCTGLDDSEIIEKSLMLGAYDCFFKPLGKQELEISLPLKVKNAKEFMKRNEEILYLCYHDYLTGLYNRRYIDEELSKLISQNLFPFSIIIGDVNGLKATNDSFGHKEGDRLLRTIAQILKEECRGGLAARKGGDEFIVLYPNTEISNIKRDMQAIKENCANRNDFHNRLSISLGCAMMCSITQSIDQVLKEAEDMMYKDKMETGHRRIN